AALLAVWREVLGHDNIGVTDNFFEVGGDSIGAMRVMALCNHLDIKTVNSAILSGLSIRDCFEEQLYDGNDQVNFEDDFASIFSELNLSGGDE
ncbi:hypothetical protein K6W36_18905, partial [Acetobacter senegalensis]|uniref:phosphopantetheine-binding protein n=1 Tax=Acetobacter senegalensis TaxID=446692 RepID=UPI001EDAAF0C